jgi:hypothetical protein
MMDSILKGVRTGTVVSLVLISTIFFGVTCALACPESARASFCPVNQHDCCPKQGEVERSNNCVDTGFTATAKQPPAHLSPVAYSAVFVAVFNIAQEAFRFLVFNAVSTAPMDAVPLRLTLRI